MNTTTKNIKSQKNAPPSRKRPNSEVTETVYLASGGSDPKKIFGSSVGSNSAIANVDDRPITTSDNQMCVLSSSKAKIIPSPSTIHPFVVTRQAADGANGSGGLSDLYVLPPPRLFGSYFTVHRRFRQEFSSTKTILPFVDVNAPIRCEFSGDTLTQALHCYQVKQFRLSTDRPPSNYAVSSFDGTSHPRIYISIRNHQVVDCAVVGCKDPGVEAGWVCDMIYDVVSCRTISDRDFVIILRKPTNETMETLKLNDATLEQMYSGKTNSFTPHELREFYSKNVCSADTHFIPTRNLWYASSSSYLAPFEESPSNKFESRRVNVTAPLFDQMSHKDKTDLSKKIYYTDAHKKEECFAVALPLDTELALDTAVRYLCDGSIVFTIPSPVKSFVSQEVAKSINKGFGPDVLNRIETFDDLDKKIYELVGLSLDHSNLLTKEVLRDKLRYMFYASKRFSFQWLDISCIMDTIATTINRTPEAPPATLYWSPDWIEKDPFRSKVNAIERRYGSLGIGTMLIVSPLKFVRLGEKMLYRDDYPVGKLAYKGSLVRNTLKRRRPLTISDTRAANFTQRSDGRFSASVYEAVVGLMAAGKAIVPYDTKNPFKLYGVPIVCYKYRNVVDGVNAAYAGIACINDLCRESDAFLYTLTGGSLDVLDKVQDQCNTHQYAVFTEPTPAGSKSLLEFCRDPTNSIEDLQHVLKLLRLQLEWAFNRRSFVHNKLDASANVFVGPKQTQSFTTALAFKNNMVGYVHSKHHVYIVGYTKATFEKCTEVHRASTNSHAIDGGQESFFGLINTDVLKTFLAQLNVLEDTRYNFVVDGSRADIKPTQIDRLPSEFYMLGAWGAVSLANAARRYLNRIYSSRVNWFECHTSEAKRLGNMRIQEIMSILRLMNAVNGADGDDNILKSLDKIATAIVRYNIRP